VDNDPSIPPAAGAPPSPPVQPSRCEPFREIILAKLEQGLSAQRIYQDLVREHGFAANYHSVRRFVRHGDDAGDIVSSHCHSEKTLQHKGYDDDKRRGATQNKNAPGRD